MITAKAMTPEELYLIDKVWNRNCIEVGHEDYRVPVGTKDAYYERVLRCPDGEIEEAEQTFKYANFGFRLDSLRYDDEGSLLISGTKPRPRFDTWQDYFASLCLGQEIPDELEGAI